MTSGRAAGAGEPEGPPAGVAAAAPVIPEIIRQPEGGADFMGKNYEDMAPMEKHQLLVAVGPEVFDLMREESRKRVAAKNS